MMFQVVGVFFFSSIRRHTRYIGDWSSDVCSSDLIFLLQHVAARAAVRGLLRKLSSCDAGCGGRRLLRHIENGRGRSEERRVGNERKTKRERTHVTNTSQAGDVTADRRTPFSKAQQ